MPTSFIALQILMILLPGFAAAYVVQMLALRQTQTDFDKVIEACLYSFLIYAFFVILAGGALPFEFVPAHLPSTEATIRWYPRRILGLAAITAVFALIGVLYINLDGNALFRKLKITERTTRRGNMERYLREGASAGSNCSSRAGGRSKYPRTSVVLFRLG